MISKVTRHFATFLAISIGIAGVAGILYAWGLPPFTSSTQVTEDAYVRGQVTTLAPQVSGAVAAVSVQDFEMIKKGDLLVQIDDSTYKQELAQAEAQLDAAQASLDSAKQDRNTAQAGVASAMAGVDSAKAALKVAESNLKRAHELRKRGVNSVTQVQDQQLAYDQALATVRQADAQVETARQKLATVATERLSRAASVEQASAAVELARINLDKTRIYAPVDGRLGEVTVRVGQYVTPGTRMLTLVPNTVWITANFKETQLAGMKVGQPVTFTVDAFGDLEMTGCIERFSPAASSEFSVLSSSNTTGNFIKIAQRIPVRIAVDPGQPMADRLSPGMSVVVSVDTKQPVHVANASGTGGKTAQCETRTQDKNTEPGSAASPSKAS